MLHTQLQIIFWGKRAVKKQNKNKNKTKTSQNHRRPATASVMQSHLKALYIGKRILTPKKDFLLAGCSPSLQPLRPEVRPLCTSGVVVAWLLRRPVFGRLSPCLAVKDNLNEPASAKPYSFPGSEQAKTVKDFNFLLFSKFLPHHPCPWGRQSTNPTCRSDFWPWI